MGVGIGGLFFIFLLVILSSPGGSESPSFFFLLHLFLPLLFFFSFFLGFWGTTFLWMVIVVYLSFRRYPSFLVLGGEILLFTLVLFFIYWWNRTREEKVSSLREKLSRVEREMERRSLKKLQLQLSLEPQRKRMEKIHSLLELANLLSLFLDKDKIYRALSSFFPSLVEKGEGYILGGEKGAWRVIFSFPSRTLLGDELIEFLMEERRSLLIKDVQRDPRAWLISRKIKSLIFTPFWMEEGEGGALLLLSEEIGKFTEEDMEIFEILSEIIRTSLTNARLYERIERLSIIDELTDLFNFRHLQEILIREIKRAEEHAHPLSLLILDIDKFKEYNDTYGHMVGDEILKQMGKVLRENTRGVDVVGRYGGDEFIVILPYQNKDQSKEVAERIRREVERRIWEIEGTHLSPTVSIGVTQWKKGMGMRELIGRADESLYRAKEGGRNRVCVNEGK